jgi:3'-5' exoribonuclease
MTKKIFIENLKVGDSIFGEPFAVKAFTKKASRNNKPYFDVELMDRTGTIRGKIWSDDIKNCDQVIEGDIVEINGTVDEFNGPQLNITNLKLTKNFEIEEFQQVTKFDTNKMWADLSKTIEGTKNPHIKKLYKNIFTPEMIEKFKTAAAAYRVHHAYCGGLLEHTWEMLKMAEALKSHFPKINMDIVNAGIILHDIGKIDEFEITTTISISDHGKLLGHIYLGAELIKSNIPDEMPEDLANEIIHIALSHHGEKEFGSPVVPMTTEALAVHTLDAASSKLNMAYTHIHGGLGTEKYTPYISHLKTELYRSPYLDKLENDDIPF